MKLIDRLLNKAKRQQQRIFNGVFIITYEDNGKWTISDTNSSFDTLSEAEKYIEEIAAGRDVITIVDDTGLRTKNNDRD